MHGRFVFAKHKVSDAKEYCFDVPNEMTIAIGDKLLVDTCCGHQVVTATSTVIQCDQYDQVVKRFGAKFPLRKVLQCCGQELQAYFQQQTANALINILIDANRKLASGVCVSGLGDHDDLPF